MIEKSPRERSPDYCHWISQLPCAVCLAHGDFTRGVHVAHLRMGSLEHGKRHTGMSEKPSDKPWTTPLCPYHHMDGGRHSQHYFPGGESAFWRFHGLDAHQLCLDLAEAHTNLRPGYAVLAKHAARAHAIRNRIPENQHG